jgi:hypothetical protein
MPRCKTPLKQTTEMSLAPNARRAVKAVVNAAKADVREVLSVVVSEVVSEAQIAMNSIAKQLAMLMPLPTKLETKKLPTEKRVTKPTTPHLSAANAVHVTVTAVTAGNAMQVTRNKLQTKRLMKLKNHTPMRKHPQSLPPHLQRARILTVPMRPHPMRPSLHCL